jgi:hypothetical protein
LPPEEDAQARRLEQLVVVVCPPCTPRCRRPRGTEAPAPGSLRHRCPSPSRTRGSDPPARGDTSARDPGFTTPSDALPRSADSIPRRTPSRCPHVPPQAAAGVRGVGRQHAAGLLARLHQCKIRATRMQLRVKALS